MLNETFSVIFKHRVELETLVHYHSFLHLSYVEGASSLQNLGILIANYYGSFEA